MLLGIPPKKLQYDNTDQSPLQRKRTELQPGFGRGVETGSSRHPVNDVCVSMDAAVKALFVSGCMLQC